MEKTKGKGKTVILWIIPGILVIGIIAAYFIIASYYRTRFFANTMINGVSVDQMSADEASGELKSEFAGYVMDVYDRDGNMAGSLNAADIDLTIVVDSEVGRLLAEQNEYEWPLQWSGSREWDCPFEITYDEEKAKSLISQWDVLNPSLMEAPQDAYISEYSSELKGYEIIPETEGTTVDVDRAEELILNGLYQTEASVSLTDCYISAQTKADDAQLIENRDALNKITGTQIIFDWNGSEVILDGDTIHEWILDDGEHFYVDEEKVAEFVSENASANDTYGQRRDFTTAGGVTLNLRSGAYGWRTDKTAETEELLALIEEGAKVTREPVYVSKGYVKGQNDIGSSYVEIDLTNQHLYLWIKGSIVLESDFVSGNVSAGNTTPAGVFGVTYKTRDAVLRGDTYETPVKYWMPFNGNIGMHDASWRSTFGGEIYLTNGSHGCINLPSSKAAQIYEYVETGFPVICYYYDGVPTWPPVQEEVSTPEETVSEEPQEENTDITNAEVTEQPLETPAEQAPSEEVSDIAADMASDAAADISGEYSE